MIISSFLLEEPVLELPGADAERGFAGGVLANLRGEGAGGFVEDKGRGSRKGEGEGELEKGEWYRVGGVMVWEFEIGSGFGEMEREGGLGTGRVGCVLV